MNIVGKRVKNKFSYKIAMIAWLDRMRPESKLAAMEPKAY